MNRYLVTGGSGFIGKNLVQKLLQKGKHITVIDTVDDLHDHNINYIKADISNYNEIVNLFKNIDCVVHLAALSNTSVCMKNPLLCNNINITGTVNVLEASREHKVKRIVCASSHVVMGGIHPLRVSKLAVENYCEVYDKLYGLSVICLRYAMIYGKNQCGGNVLNAFRDSIRTNGYVTITGDGSQTRDFLHVSDCVEATYLATESCATGIIDICSGISHSLNYVATELFKTKIIYAEKRSGDADTFCQSPKLAQDILKFQAKIPLELGIREYYEKSCLIGYTGFVGINLLKHMSFDDYYNTTNILTLKNKVYDTIVFCALPGLVWAVNNNPDSDLTLIYNFIELLKTVLCKKFILISTINVYDQLNSMKDESWIPSSITEAYGKHRLYFENYIRSSYNEYHIIRLPALYGLGLEKGIIYDLLQENYLHNLNINDIYQFYDLNDLALDIEKCVKQNISVINLFPEPISVKTLIDECFRHYTLDNSCIRCDHNCYYISQREAKKYNICTKYGSVKNYLYDSRTVLEKIKLFKKKMNTNIIISNIAWNNQDIQIQRLLHSYNIDNLEIAPTMLCSWENLTCDIINNISPFKIYSIQSITYGMNHLSIFDDTSQQLLVHIKRLIDIFSRIGCKIIIFGCPHNRNITQAYNIMQVISFFKELGNYATEHDCCVVIETMCRKYGCNYINTIPEAINLIEKVNSPGFQLHIDTGNIYEENEDPELLRKYRKYIKHVQISVFGLQNFDTLPINYNKRIAGILKDINYSGKISIEMKHTSDTQINYNNIRKAIRLIHSIYS